MEWWYTVERESQSARLYLEREGVVINFFCLPEWDELPSDDENRVDEST